MLQRRPHDAGRRADAPTEANASFERALDTRRTPPQSPRQRRRRVWSDVFWCLLGAFTLFVWFADTRPRPRQRAVEAAAASAQPALTPPPFQVAGPAEQQAPASGLVQAPPQERVAVAQAPRARAASRRAAHKHAKRAGKLLATRAKPKHRPHGAKFRRRS
jgi:hypothetical protein